MPEGSSIDLKAHLEHLDRINRELV